MYKKIKKINNIYKYLSKNDINIIQNNIDNSVIRLNFKLYDILLNGDNYLIKSKNILLLVYKNIFLHIFSINIKDLNDIIVYIKYNNYNLKNNIIVNYNIDSKSIKYIAPNKSIEYFNRLNYYIITLKINIGTYTYSFFKYYINCNVKYKTRYYNDIYIIHNLYYKNYNIYIFKKFYKNFNKCKNFNYYLSFSNKLLLIIN